MLFPVNLLPSTEKTKNQQEGQHPLTGQCAVNFRLLANQWAERRLVTQWRHSCRAMRWSVSNAGASNAGRSLCVQISRERTYPLPIHWYHSKGNWLCYNFAAQSFYIMKLCSRLFVLYWRNCPKDNKFRYFISHFEEVRGGIEPWLMARWKARDEVLLSVIELLFLSLAVEALQGKMYQNSLPSGGGRSLGAKISGERVAPPAIYWYHSKGNWLRYNFAAESFYIMKLCSRLFVLYCRNCAKDDKFR